jgi:hypothetical protein
MRRARLPARFPPDRRRLQPPWEFLQLGAARGEDLAFAAWLEAELEGGATSATTAAVTAPAQAAR